MMMMTGRNSPFDATVLGVGGWGAGARETDEPCAPPPQTPAHPVARSFPCSSANLDSPPLLVRRTTHASRRSCDGGDRAPPTERRIPVLNLDAWPGSEPRRRVIFSQRLAALAPELGAGLLPHLQATADSSGGSGDEATAAEAPATAPRTVSASSFSSNAESCSASSTGASAEC